MTKPLRLIYVEDSTEFADLAERHLRDELANIEIVRVATLGELKKQMANGPWDIVLSGYRMRRFDAFRILKWMASTNPTIPLIVVSDVPGREAVSLFRAGARDVIGSEALARLSLTIRREIEHAKHRARQQQTEAALRNSRNTLQTLIDSTDEFVSMIGADERLLVANRALAKRFHLDPKDLKGRRISDFFSPADAKPRLAAIRRAFRSKAVIHQEFLWKDRVFDTRFDPVLDENGAAVAVVVFSRDATHVRRAEEALRESESRLRAIVDNTTASISLKDRSDKYLLINKEFARRVGRREEDILGRTVADIMEPDFAKRLKQLDRRVIHSKEPITEEIDLPGTGGSTRSFLISKFPIVGPDGRISGVGTITTDITEHRAVERALRISEERFRAFMDASPESLLLKDPTGRYLAVNNAFEKRFGKSSDQVIGRRANETFPEQQSRLFERHDEEIRSTGKILYHEIDTTDARGARLLERVVKFPIKDSDGSLVGVGSIAFDITPLKLAQDALENSNRALRTLSACNEVLIRAKSEDELLNEVCNTIVEVGGYPFAWIGFAQNDKTRIVRPIAMSGHPELSPSQYCPSWAAGPRGRCPTGIAIRTGEPCVVRDGFKAKRFEACRTFAEDNGYMAAIALPLKIGGRVFGALTIFSDAQGIFDDNEVTRLTELANDVNFGIGALREAADREHAEEDRRMLSRAVEQSPTVVIITDAEGIIEYVNPKFIEVTGYAEREVIGQRPNLLKSGETNDAEYKALWKSISAGNRWRGVFHNRRKDGSYYWADTTISPVRAVDGTVTHYVGIQEDITARLETEQRMNQMEKMESLGNLAGGIAHDFNNMLLPIQSLTAMTLRDLPEDSPATKRLQKVIEASQCAGDLVKRILTFSRAEDAQRRPEDIHRVVGEAMDLLRSTIPSTVRIVERTTRVGDVVMDSAQIQTVLLNLASNAADAMSGRPGTLYVTLSRAQLTNPLATPNAVIESGDYAKITVRDTGSGMPPEVVDRIFEPFFTTKGVGEGTGLGLAMVHGIVTKHGGAITVASEPGLGTTFDIYLPVLGKASRSRIAA